MRGVLVAIDLETIGLDASDAQIIEIGAATFRDHEIIETYTTLVDANGWAVYQLPEGSYPWGITITNQVWMVDNFRKVLANIPLPAASVQVMACKQKDLDGQLNTSVDRTPVAGWTVYLTVNGTRQTPGSVTGSDGCATWAGSAARRSASPVPSPPSMNGVLPRSSSAG